MYGRVDQDHAPARHLRFVANEGKHLRERPTVQHSALALRTRFPSPLPNPFAVFKSCPALGALPVLTMALDKHWVTSLTNRRSRPLRFLSRRLLDLVSFCWSWLRKRR